MGAPLLITSFCSAFARTNLGDTLSALSLIFVLCVRLRVFFHWFVYYLGRVNNVLGAPSKAWSTFESIITNMRLFFLSPLCTFCV